MLTPAQYSTLKAHIAASADLTAIPDTPDGAIAIADLLNLPSSPAVTVWRTSVEAAEIMANGFVWTEVDALTNSKARIWDWMTRYGSFNPARPNVRQGLRDCFGVSSGTYTGMLPHLRRAATRMEALFATGTGTEANPATLTYEGPVSYQDVQQARRS